MRAQQCRSSTNENAGYLSGPLHCTTLGLAGWVAGQHASSSFIFTLTRPAQPPTKLQVKYFHRLLMKYFRYISVNINRRGNTLHTTLDRHSWFFMDHFCSFTRDNICILYIAELIRKSSCLIPDLLWHSLSNNEHQHLLCVICPDGIVNQPILVHSVSHYYTSYNSFTQQIHSSFSCMNKFE